MKFGDILYVIAMIVFAWITFAIVRGNFQRKFDEEGRRRDLADPNEKTEKRNEKSSGEEKNDGE